MKKIVLIPALLQQQLNSNSNIQLDECLPYHPTINLFMKQIIVILAMSIAFAACKKSPVTPIVPPGGGTSVYVAGYENKVAQYWKNGTVVMLGDPALNTVINSIVVVGNDVYAGGYEINNNSSPVKVAKYWKNGTGVTLTDPAGISNVPEINSMAVSGNDVYAAGHERNSNSIGIARYWKNGTAVSLSGKSDSSRAAMINGIAVLGSDVYCAGYETVLRVDGGTTYGVIVAKYWKNGTDIPLAGTSGFAPTSASSIAVVGADVYIAGYGSGGVNIGQTARYWKNGALVILPTETINESAANAITVAGSDLYVAGYEIIAGKRVAKYWKNGAVVKVTDGTHDAIANGIAVDGSDVYVAGYELDNSFNYIAKYWKNGTAVPLTDGSKVAIATSIVVVN
jgi:hypothetical protein